MSKTHDFCAGRWAHAIVMSYDQPNGPGGEYRVKWGGNGLGLKVGDVILRTMQSGKIGKFKILKCEYKSDPRDLFFVVVEFVGHAELGEIESAIIEKRPNSELNPKFSG